MSDGIVAFLLGLAATIASASAWSDDGSVSLPAHDYVLVDQAASADPARALAIIRDALLRAIVEARLAEPGYPAACSVRSAPDPRRPGARNLSCTPHTESSTERDGILLDAEGRFIQLGIVDFPDSRLYLMEIFVVPELPYPKLHSEQRWTVPRVVLRHPRVPRAWHPAIWSVLGRGVKSSGATVLP